MHTMKANVFHGSNKIGIEEVPRPRPGFGEAVIRITLTTICGTDLHILRGEYPVNRGLVIGHEAVGVIEELGEGVSGYKIGERVLVGAITPCGQCRACLSAQWAQCGHGEGVEAIGGWRFGNTINGAQGRRYYCSCRTRRRTWRRSRSETDETGTGGVARRHRLDRIQRSGIGGTFGSAIPSLFLRGYGRADWSLRKNRNGIANANVGRFRAAESSRGDVREQHHLFVGQLDSGIPARFAWALGTSRYSACAPLIVLPNRQPPIASTPSP